MVSSSRILWDCSWKKQLSDITVLGRHGGVSHLGSSYRPRYPIKVFLSSSMADEQSLEQRKAVKAVIDRIPLYCCFIVESHANPEKVIPYCLNKIDDSDLVLLVLQKELRYGVIKEFQYSVKHHKRIFTFAHASDKSDDLIIFIENDVYPICTVGAFTDIGNLIDQIERCLLDDLIERYRSMYAENRRLKKQIEQLGSGPNQSIRYS